MLEADRQPFLSMARECAEVTIPTLMPPQGAGKNWRQETPYQSVGARGVSNLAAKLLLALLPPNAPFFRLQVDTYAMKKISEDPATKTQLEKALSEMEQAVMADIETTATRCSVSTALNQAVLSGNALLHVLDSGKLKVHRLDKYVVERDPEGEVLTIIIKEEVSPAVLSEEIVSEYAKDTKEKTLELYTVCYRSSPTKFEVWQELGDKFIDESHGWYPIEACPFIPIRFIREDGESYGRGLCEQYLGDLKTLESLSKALVEGSVASSKVVFLVAPNGVTSATKLSKAPNGAFVAGRTEDVAALQINKAMDFNWVFQQTQNIERRLNLAFLLTQGVTRDAERVTAEEIRALIQELETSLGGVYALLAQELQLPLATSKMRQMAKQGRLPKLPKKIVKPAITTGVEALGRGNDLQKLRSLSGVLKETLDPQTIATYMNPSEFISRAATALAIDPEGLIKTADEVAQQQQAMQQQAQQQEMVTKLGPAGIKAMSDQLKNGQQAEQPQ